MAPQVDPEYQEFFDLPDGTSIAVTKFKTLNSNNSVVIAPPAYVPVGFTGGNSGIQLKDIGDTTQVGGFYLGTTGTLNINNVSSANLNKSMTFITLHKTSNGTV